MVTMGISSSLLSGPAHLSRSFILSCLIALVCPTLAQAQDSPTQDEMTYYFLKDVDYGSQSTFGPLQVILNSGFDILRSGSFNFITTSGTLRWSALRIFMYWLDSG